MVIHMNGRLKGKLTAGLKLLSFGSVVSDVGYRICAVETWGW